MSPLHDSFCNIKKCIESRPRSRRKVEAAQISSALLDCKNSRTSSAPFPLGPPNLLAKDIPSSAESLSAILPWFRMNEFSKLVKGGCVNLQTM